MKITDPDVIRDGERDLINAVKDDLDWNAVKEIIKNKINMKSFESKGGEIVVLNGRIAFRIDLELKMGVRLMFDREGNYISGDDSNVISDASSAELSDDLDMDSDFGLEFTSDEEELELNEALESGDKIDGASDSDSDLEGKPDPDGEKEVFDNEIDDDIDDILEETRDLWKQKKE